MISTTFQASFTRRIARMTHHRQSVGCRRDDLAILLDHGAGIPARVQYVELTTDVLGSLLRPVDHNLGERVARVSARLEDDLDPFRPTGHGRPGILRPCGADKRGKTRNCST